ncbi:hypothetical protein [Clostridium akagii]|uniref:hypothetical protein n=1 Tax=Clostridium akagii TaxID=91623 RepID=UPI000691F616|nr:hypothetical protein [Clostridium akagii]
MKKLIIGIFCLFVITITAILLYEKSVNNDPLSIIKPKIIIDNIKCNSDKNKNSIDDLDDIVIGARQDAINRTK